MVIKRINMIILMEHDLDAAVEFYKQLGGLDLKFHMRGKWAEFEADGVKIGLCPISVEAEDPEIDRRTGLVFEVDDVPALYERFKDTFTFMNEPIERVHGIMVSIKDPGGNIIDLYQPTPEKLKDLVARVKERTESSCAPERDEDAGCCGGCNDENADG